MGRLTRSIWPVLALAVGLRLAGLGRVCLWYDEAFTAWLARLSWPAMIAATAGDVHPPTWYAVTMGAVRLFGSSEAALRLPAAILGIVNAWLLWRVALVWGLDRRAAWLAALLLAVSPVSIYYSQEARAYQLLTLAVLIMAYAVPLWCGWRFVAGGIVAVWSHNLGIVYVGTMAVLALLWRWRECPPAGRQPGLAMAGWLGLIMLGWLPWLVVVFGQVGAVAGGFWVQPPTLGAWLAGWPWLVWGPVNCQWVALAGAPVAMMLAGLSVFGAVLARRWELALWLLLPGLGLVLLSLAWCPVYMERLLLPCVPALAMLLALALLKSGMARRLATPGGLLLVAWLALFYLSPIKSDLRPYTQTIRDGWRPGDLVFHGNLSSYILFDYYLPELDSAVWSQANDLSQSLTGATKEAMGMHGLTVADLARYKRLWLVWSETPMTAPAELAVIGGMVTAWRAQPVVIMEDTPTVHAAIYLVDLESDAWQSH